MVWDRLILILELLLCMLGIFNFVGYRQQVETIRIGDIEDEVQYGNDFFPDWDSTAIVDPFLRHTCIRMGYTWRKDASSFNLVNWIMFSIQMLLLIQENIIFLIHFVWMGLLLMIMD